MSDFARRAVYVAFAVLLLSVIGTVIYWNAEPEEDDAADAIELQTDMEYYRQLAGQNISINVYNWGEYISDGSDGLMDVNREFEKLTGIRVYYSNFATNEELYSKLRSGNANYDVIIPSDYMIGRMIRENMLTALDYDKIPNFENIEENFLEPEYDVGNLYTAPYTWGVVGIIYNTGRIMEDEITSWDILWDENYAGDILMFANPRDAFGIVQRRLGYSMNTTNSEELQECLEALKAQKPLVQAYVMDEIFDKMLGGEAALAPYYAGDAITMIDENDMLDFAIPEEGTNIFVDAMCIPAGSRQVDAAHMYINFMLEAEVGAANAEYIGYASPNGAAKELLDEEIIEDPIAYPPQEVVDNAEYFLELPRETNLLMDSMWTELLSSDDYYNRMFVPILLLFAVLLSVGINIWRSYTKRRKPYF